MYLNETYSRVHVVKHLSDKFPFTNGLKQGDALSSLLFNFTSEYTIQMASGKPGRLDNKWYTSASSLC
jgi:hypothetical protein